MTNFKYLTGILVLLAGFSSMAAVCAGYRPLWDSDKILEQYECGNSITAVCVTKAIFGSDKSTYVEAQGAVNMAYGTFRIRASSREGSLNDSNGILTLQYAPVPAAIIDSYKVRSQLILNKKELKASFVEQHKDVLSLQFWKNYVEQSNLSCNKIK